MKRTYKQSKITGSSGYAKKRLIETAGTLAKEASKKLIRNAFKKWKAKSNTKTKTKKLKTPDANDGHSAISSHRKLIIINTKTPKHDKGRWQYNITYQGILNGGAGQQGVNHFNGIALNNQISISSGPTYNIFQTANALQQMNPYLVNTGSTLLSSRVPRTDKFILKSVEYDLEFTNLTSGSATVEVYFITPKHPMNDDPMQSWNACNAEAGAGLSTQTFPIPGSTSAASGAQQFNNPHTDPFENKPFRRLWKLLSKTVFQMGPAAVETFKTNIIYNKVINMDVIDKELIDGLFAHPNLGIYVLCIQRGQPVVEKVLTSNLMTYASTQIGFISRIRYDMYPISGNAGRVDVQVSHSNVPQGADKASQFMVDNEDVVNSLDVVV